jgi:hypothetical protein
MGMSHCHFVLGLEKEYRGQVKLLLLLGEQVSKVSELLSSSISESLEE